MKIKLFEQFNIDEKNLSRTLQHVKNDEFAVLTAWRSKSTITDNLRNMKKIEGDLSTFNYGFIDMHGVGQEHEGKSYEKSLMIINHDNREHFREVMLDLAKTYKQDFILYGKDGKTYLVDVQTEENVQTFTKAVEGEAEYYSAIKGINNKKHTFHLQESENSIWAKYGDNLPTIFKSTIYRLPTQDELKEFENFNFESNEIIQGFGYTIVGRGIKSTETKNLILQSINALCEMFPSNNKYKEALAIRSDKK